MKTRILTLAMALVAQLATLSAETVETTNNGLTYTIDLATKTATIKSLNDYSYTGEYVIYPTVYYNGTFYPVTRIGRGAFSTRPSLTSVIIPEGVTCIESHAFWQSERLASVVIPESVDSIGESAFYRCICLSSLKLPDGLTQIEDYTFQECGLTEIHLPDNLTSIGVGAFEHCDRLLSITLPEGVTSIGNRAFYHCSVLSSVTLPESLTSIGSDAFYACTSLSSINFPEGLTSIESSAFYGCGSLSSINFPESLTQIAHSAFYNTQWYEDQPKGLIYIGTKAYLYKGIMPKNTTITLRAGTTAIMDEAFVNRDSLVAIIIPESVTSIGKKAFSNCQNLATVTLPKGLKRINSYTFGGCVNLTSVTLPEGLTEIGDHAFWYCLKLTAIDIPEGVTRIDNGAFSVCVSLSSVTLPSSLNFIGGGIFSGAPWLDSLPDGVVYINKIAFDYHGEMPEDTRIRLKEGTTCIAGSFNSTDEWDDKLTSVVIPESVTHIGSYSFMNNRNLKAVYCDPLTLPEMGTNVFSLRTVGEGWTYSYDHLSQATLYVNHAALETYQAAGEPWNQFGSIVPTYALKYVVDGEVYERYDLLPGEATPAASAPTLEHAHFSGWNEPTPATMPDHDVVLTGQFFRESIPIFYFIGDEVYKSTVVGYGLPIPAIEAPTKPGFKFDHWEGLPADNIMPADPVYAHAVFVPQCATPKLAYSDSQLRITCATEGAQCHTTLSNADLGMHEGNEIQFAMTYVIQSYATAEGLADSETVTATLCWLEASPEAWGEHITVGIEEGRQKPLIIQRHANALTIEGTEPGTVVSAYDLNGRMLGTANTQEGTTVVPLQAAPGTQPVILHIGQKSVKVL